MHPEDYRDTVSGSLKFEVRSFLGRLLYNKKPPVVTDKANLLHLGCGSCYEQGWINADFFALRFWKSPFDWHIDMRYPLNCEDDVIDGIFTEHALEHLYPQQVLNLLKELHRVMKIGAILRICLPDLEKIVDFYQGGRNVILEPLHPYRATAVWGLTQNWGHRSVWDAELLEKYLVDAGFHNIQKMDYHLGDDSRLLIENEVRRDVSFYMECQK